MGNARIFRHRDALAIVLMDVGHHPLHLHILHAAAGPGPIRPHKAHHPDDLPRGIIDRELGGEEPVLGPRPRKEGLHAVHDRLAGAHDVKVVLPDAPSHGGRVNDGVRNAQILLLRRGSDAPQHAPADGDEAALAVLGKVLHIRQVLEKIEKLPGVAQPLEKAGLERQPVLLRRNAARVPTYNGFIRQSLHLGLSAANLLNKQPGHVTTLRGKQTRFLANSDKSLAKSDTLRLEGIANERRERA